MCQWDVQQLGHDELQGAARGRILPVTTAVLCMGRGGGVGGGKEGGRGEVRGAAAAACDCNACWSGRSFEVQGCLDARIRGHDGGALACVAAADDDDDAVCAHACSVPWRSPPCLHALTRIIQ